MGEPWLCAISVVSIGRPFWDNELLVKSLNILHSGVWAFFIIKLLDKS